MKCRTAEAAACVRQKDALCSDCLVQTVESKFRTQLKTYAAIRPRDRVLIENDGSIEAQSALNLLLLHRHADASTVRRGKTYFTLTVLHLKSSEDSVNDFIAAEVLQRHEENAEGIELERVNYEAVDWRTAFPNLDATSHVDLEGIRKRRFLLNFAKEKGFSKLLLLDTATSMATDLLAKSCKGGGTGVSAGLELMDRRFEPSYGVVCIRPLKELSVTELGFYCRFEKLNIDAKWKETKSSVNGLAESFVHLLKETYPSGVSSMLSVGSKMETVDWKQQKMCLLCSEPLEDAETTYCYPCQTHIVSKSTSEQIHEILRLLQPTETP